LIVSYFQWPEYVSVTEQRRRAQKELAKLIKKGCKAQPVTVEGRDIAKTFWGKSWCANLERYSDFASRLPRGRSYVRNGLVIDLTIAKGRISAKVSGSDLYDVVVTISAVATKRWTGICADCSGSIDSLVELLQGRMAKSVMDRVCREGDGLFPAPDEIKLSCSCPDAAGMCKHVAATLYGVGARLDQAPRLIFELRGVDAHELLVNAGQDMAVSKSAPVSAKLLDSADVGTLFGLEMADTTTFNSPVVGRASSRGVGKAKVGKASTPPAAHAKKPRQPKNARGKRATSKPKRRVKTRSSA
jgi:uncharacterized Zn finger protein